MAVWLALWVKVLAQPVPVRLVLLAAAVLVLSVAVLARVLREARLAAEAAARRGRVPAAAAAVVSVPVQLRLVLVLLAAEAAVHARLAALLEVLAVPVVGLQLVVRRPARVADRQVRGLLLVAVRRRQEVVGLPVASLLAGL